MLNKFEINSNNISMSKFMKDFFIDHQIKKIMKQRNNIEAKQKWLDEGFKWTDINYVFDIINQYCSWPNNSFWPKDELLYILRSYSSSLDGVSILMKLEEVYNIKIPDFNSSNPDLLWLISVIFSKENKN